MKMMIADQINTHGLLELESLIFGQGEWREAHSLREVVAAFEAGHQSLIAEIPWKQTIGEMHYTRNTVVLRGIDKGEIFFFSPLKPRRENIGKRVQDQGPPHKIHRDGSFSMELGAFQLMLMLGGKVLVPESTPADKAADLEAGLDAGIDTWQEIDEDDF